MYVYVYVYLYVCVYEPIYSQKFSIFYPIAFWQLLAILRIQNINKYS